RHRHRHDRHHAQRYAGLSAGFLRQHAALRGAAWISVSLRDRRDAGRGARLRGAMHARLLRLQRRRRTAVPRPAGRLAHDARARRPARTLRGEPPGGRHRARPGRAGPQHGLFDQVARLTAIRQQGCPWLPNPLGCGGNPREDDMAKAYWVACYRSISNPDALAAYAKLAAPAIQAAGGKFLARGTAAKAYEAGLTQRVVIIEFDSVERAAAPHGTHRYQPPLQELGSNAVKRDLRIVEGVA